MSCLLTMPNYASDFASISPAQGQDSFIPQTPFEYQLWAKQAVAVA